MAGFWKSIGNFFTGTPEKRENVSTLLPEQEELLQQGLNAAKGPGAGGAFGDVADYYRNNLSDNPADFNAFAAPAMRQYNQDIIPGISEQFAGMGSGGLSSSGFRNAQVQGATDLSERLGALRAQLRQNSAQGLQNIGQLGLQNYSQNMVTQPGTEGFLPSLSNSLGSAVTSLAGGFANSYGNKLGENAFGGTKVGANSSPYGANNSASQSSGPSASPSFNSQLPNFNSRMR